MLKNLLSVSTTLFLTLSFMPGLSAADDQVQAMAEKIQAMKGQIQALSSTPAENAITAVSEKLHALRIKADRIAPVDKQSNLIEIDSNGETFFASADGRYLFFGQTIDTSGALPVNLTLLSNHRKAQALVNKGSAITYKAKNQKAELIVFTDITCGYCQRFHASMPQLNSEGITVHYLAFPREGIDSQSSADMQNAFCAKSPQEALDALMNRLSVPAVKNCSRHDVRDHLALAKMVDVKGTPTIMLPTGQVEAGAHPVELWKQLLGLSAPETKKHG